MERGGESDNRLLTSTLIIGLTGPIITQTTGRSCANPVCEPLSRRERFLSHMWSQGNGPAFAGKDDDVSPPSVHNEYYTHLYIFYTNKTLDEHDSMHWRLTGL